jgi:hypothetical protein
MLPTTAKRMTLSSPIWLFPASGRGTRLNRRGEFPDYMEAHSQRAPQPARGNLKAQVILLKEIGQRSALMGVGNWKKKFLRRADEPFFIGVLIVSAHRRGLVVIPMSVFAQFRTW